MSEPNYETVVPTNVKYVYLDQSTGKFWFADETEQLRDNGPYDTLEAAEKGLNTYADWLNGPPKAVNTTANLPQCTVKYYGG